MNDGPHPVEVDCRFAADGAVRVRRVRWEGRWRPVEQGRQWQDDDGRHVLIMLGQDMVRELCLSPKTLRWELRPLGRDRHLA